MTTEEFGAYFRILVAMWRNRAKLPDVAEELALIAGLPLMRWLTIAEKVRRPMLSADGWLTQKKLTEAWMKVEALQVQRIAAGKARWSKR